MTMILLFLIFFCGNALATKTEETKQSKREILDSSGWVGIPNSHAYGHGQPWLHDLPWKGDKFPPFDLPPKGLHNYLAYDKVRGIPLPIGGTDYVKTIPVYITKHVVLEKPVYIEKPYHVPVAVEKVIHKPIPVPVPVPEPIPVPIKHPVPVPIQQPYPIPVKQVFPVAVPVPVPIPVHPPLFTGPAVSYGRGYGGGHFYPPPFHGPPLPPHFVHGLGHSFNHGFGYGFSNEYGHGHGYVHPPPVPPPPPPYDHDYGHGHEHKEQNKD